MGRRTIWTLIVLAIFIIGQIDKAVTQDSLLSQDGLPDKMDLDLAAFRRSLLMPQNISLTAPFESDDVEENAMRRGMPGLPDLKALMGDFKMNKDKTKFTYKGCVIDMSGGDNKYVLDFSDDTCRDTVSIPSIIKKFKKGDTEKCNSKFMRVMSKFNVDKIELDTDKGDVKLECGLKESFSLFRKSIRIKKADIKLDFNYKNSFAYKEVGFDIDGETKIGSTKVGLTLKKKRGDPLTLFDLKADTIKMKEIFDNFNKEDDDGEIEGDDISKKVSDGGIKGFFKKINVEGARFNGKFDLKKKNAELLIQGAVKNIPHLEKAQFFVNIKVLKEKKSPQVAVVVKLEGIKPVKIISALLEKISGKNLEKVPVINDIETDVILEYANANMGVPTDKVMTDILKEVHAKSEITKGVKIKLTFPLEKIVEKNELNVAPGTDLNPYIIIHIKGTQVRFEFPPDVIMDMANFLVAFVPNFSKWALKKIFKTAEIRIPQFLVDVKTQEVDIKLETAKLFTIGKNFISLDQANFELTHKKEGEPWNFKITSAIGIGDGTMDILIQKNGDEYELSAKIDQLSTADLLEKFAAGSTIQKVMNKMAAFNFGIKDVEIVAKFGGKLSLRVKGQALFVDIWSASFEAYILEQDEKSKVFGFGLYITNVDMNDLAKEMFERNGKTIKTVDSSLLSQLKFSLMVGNSGDLDFEREDLKKIMEDSKAGAPLSKTLPDDGGAMFQADLLVPEGCNADKICCFVKKHIGAGQSLKMIGIITLSEFYLEVRFEGNIELTKKMTLKTVSLMVTISLKPEIAIAATCDVQPKGQDEPLTLGVKLSASATGTVMFSFSMKGEWQNAFGFKFLRIADFDMTVGFNPVAFQPIFRMSGTLKFGYKEPIELTLAGGYLGGEVPPGFYFYIKLSSLTIESVARAFGKDISIPKAVAESGFPTGLEFGISVPKAYQVTKNVKLDAGFMFVGTLKILGLEMYMELRVNIPKSFYLKACFKGFNFAGGLIGLYGYEDDETGVVEDGPILEIKLAGKTFLIKIQGTLSVLYIAIGADIEISNAGIKFTLKGTFMNWFRVKVMFTAPFGTPIKKGSSSTGWSFGFCLDNNVISDVKKEAVNTVGSAKKDIDTAETEEAKSREPTVWYRMLRGIINYFNGKIAVSQGQIDDKVIYWKNKAAKKLKPNCVAECHRTESVYVGGVIMKTCKIAEWDLNYPVWHPTRIRREDPSCLAKCYDEYWITYLAKHKAFGTKELGLFLKWELEVKAYAWAVKQISKVMPAAERFGQALAAGWKAFKGILAKGKEILNAIKEYAINNLLYIETFCIDTTLGSWNDGMKFKFALHMWIGGKERGKEINIPEREVQITASYLKDLAWEAATSAFPKLKEIWGKVKGIKEDMANSPEKGKFARFIDSVKSKFSWLIPGLSDYRHEDADNKRSEIPAVNVAEFGKRFKSKQDIGDISDPRVIELFQSDQDVPIRDDEMVMAFRRIFSPLPEAQEEENPESRSTCAKKDGAPIDADTSTDTDDKTLCGGLRKATKVYGGATDTLKFLVDKSDITKAEYETFIQEYSSRFTPLEQKIQDELGADADDEDRAEAMYYVNLYKEGVLKWKADWDKEQDDAERKALKTWSGYFGKLDTKSLKKILDTTTNEAVKRNELPKESHNKLQQSLKSAEKNLRHLSQDDGATLSSKKSHINDLIKDVELMKEIAGGLKCQ